MQSSKLKRRNLLKWGGASALVIAGAGLGPMLLQNRKVFKRTQLLMGSFGEIQIVHDDEKQVNQWMNDAFQEALRIEKLMTRFQDDSDIGRLNQNGFGQVTEVSPETFNVVERALHWSKVTDGRFDPAIGKLSHLWNVESERVLPETKQVQELASRNFYQQIQLSSSANQKMISLNSADVQLDLGGIAKGYAVDQVAELLKNRGVEQALINFGGDLMVLGSRDDSKAWRVGIKDPHHPEKIAKVLELKNQAVATSGNYERFSKSENGELLTHHLIDPNNARPGRSQFHGLTIIGSNCQDVDALATGLYFMDDQLTQRTLEDQTENFSTVRLG